MLDSNRLHLFLAALTTGLLGMLLPHTLHAQVYRCGNSYSDAPCQGAKHIERQAPLQADASAHSDVFLCRLGDRHFWSAQSCQSQNASMLHRQSVPRHWTWEQQHQHAQREWLRAQRQTAAKKQPPHHTNTRERAQRRTQHLDCSSAEQRIRQLDEMGRRGGSVRYMERLRSERKELRDGQFRAGC